MYLPFSPYRFLRAKGADTLCIYPTPCPEEGTLPDTWATPKLTHRGKHRSGGAQVPGKNPILGLRPKIEKKRRKISVSTCVFPVEPQSPNGENTNLHKVGFPPIPGRAPISAQNRTFVHRLALFPESAETPVVKINVFAVWALRLDRKYTTFGLPEKIGKN